MKVEVDSLSGFCFGVRNAVEIAERSLVEGRVYSLGPIVHNDMEVKRLAAMGLVSIDHSEFSALKNCKVLIRAHGEPPDTYATAKSNNIEIIEATCPIVKKLQRKIKQTWERDAADGSQTVIFGKPGHAEVTGLLGQINKEGIIVTAPDSLPALDFNKPVNLFAQTTMSIRDYALLAEAIKAKYRESGANPDVMVKTHKTICRQISDREPHLKEFAGNHDVIIFVSGNESSNGRMLYQVCKSINPATYFVAGEGDLDILWFKDRKTAGICGATSTPKWLIEKIKDAAVKMLSKHSCP
ncbi:MAG: 4-hydroxy-3-methylbut-2-enyl diphosphate reductase [Bacteroidales bacterium]|jgi:4-hydroxy-3-methylbut-2-enyl diphosphate reductase|nr:4-hydroxy-3-methylbut-2-enyl diphosphate reductase [Bacteroidales bacterium]